MTAVVALVAFLVTLAALLAAAGHAGYLAMLASAAKKRPGGEPAVKFARSRIPVAGAGLAVTLLAFLIGTGDSVGADIFAMLLAGGGGFGSVKALQTTQSRFRKGEF
ncbi:hypothetical protein [Saccharopolyspora rectivirgula]|jgi:hypothetical protein|uniref:Uncharacterized protein n=1 Tax=Saccharopolyspora rectivirgula TaxID=28042 RepID=A0A073AZF4_9PSEU|nr:hypothetical protein [Saccharopolyspora rectivirgula]KEI45118.1 hypothetical protein GU90_04830 [Saccharopolyspora rectivirgula]